MYVAMKSSLDDSGTSLDGYTPDTVAQNTFLARVSPVAQHEASGKDLRTARDRCSPTVQLWWGC